LGPQIAPEEIDRPEHVNKAVYLRVVQEVATAHWVAAATEAQRETIGWVVVRHEIDTLSPARLGDDLVARTWVGPARKHLFERHVEIVRASDQTVIARARSVWRPIDLHTRRLMRVGADVYERFSVPDDAARPAD
jgi:acyl-CoA thioester hydrolase